MSSLQVWSSSLATATLILEWRDITLRTLHGTVICLHAKILATSKLIYSEALPVLYKDKIFWGTTRDFRQPLKNTELVEHVRHVEIAECLSCYHDLDFHSILCRLQSLPRIRSLSILSACLYVQEYGIQHTIPQFCKEADLGEATCIDIGRYQLHGKFSEFQFVHRRLVQLWPSVKSTPADYDPFEDFASMRKKWPSRGNSEGFTA